MVIVKRCVVACFISTLLFTLPHPPSSVKAQQRSNRLSGVQVARLALPHVVIIECANDDGERSTGSGFFVTPTIVVTNYHVIDGMTRGIIQLVDGKNKGRIYRIKSVLEGSKQFDVALLHVPDSASLRLKGLRLETDVSRVQVGEQIYVVSNPQGLTGTISSGIVSSIRVSDKSALIQISAPVSEGSSGGAVIDSRGRTIGMISSSLAHGQNLNFAVLSIFIKTALRLSKSALRTSTRSRSSEDGNWIWLAVGSESG